MSLFDGLKETLNIAKDAQTLPALRERLALAQEQMLAAEKKAAAIEAENIELLRENRELRTQLSAAKKDSGFLDLGMCLLKAKPDGGYFDTPLCPSCKKPLSDFIPGKLVCGSCSIALDPMTVRAAVKKALAS